MTSLSATTERIRAAEAIAECRLIASMSEEPVRNQEPLQTTRRFLTPPVVSVHAHLRTRMQALGMSVHTDAIGNLRGLWQPPNATGKRLLLGSHIDTVPNAGAFDGVLGVVLALEWVRLAQEQNLPLPIEVVAFSEEEGVRYPVSFLSSHALAGTLDLKVLDLVDADGIRIEDAIRAFGLDPSQIPAAAIDSNVLGYIELHIEQGPVLDVEGLPLAVVEGIAGQSRLGFRFIGHANHAGTTPMHLRRDALAAAATWMTEIESLARNTEGLVATIGKLTLEPNATNVIPGCVDLSLDLRHMNDQVLAEALQQSVQKAQATAADRGLQVEWIQKTSEPSIRMDPALSSELAAAVQAAGYPPRSIPSGAGHDAMILAHRVPSAMLFLRSPGGISHHPDETVLEEDVEAALKTGRIFLSRIAKSNSASVLK